MLANRTFDSLQNNIVSFVFTLHKSCKNYEFRGQLDTLLTDSFRTDSACNTAKIYGLRWLGSRHNSLNSFQKRTIRKCQNCWAEEPIAEKAAQLKAKCEEKTRSSNYFSTRNLSRWDFYCKVIKLFLFYKKSNLVELNKIDFEHSQLIKIQLN